MNREALLDSAIRTLNARPTAPMAVIASEAGISRATLHRHFDSRDALVYELGVRGTDRWEASLDASHATEAAALGGATRLDAALRDMIERYVQDAEIFGFVLTEPRLEDVPELSARARALEDRERSIYAAAQEAGLLRRDLTASWIALALFGLLVAARDGLRGGDLAPREVTDMVTNTFFEGCGQ